MSRSPLVEVGSTDSHGRDLKENIGAPNLRFGKIANLDGLWFGGEIDDGIHGDGRRPIGLEVEGQRSKAGRFLAD
jgi:hypothetical protein